MLAAHGSGEPPWMTALNDKAMMETPVPVVAENCASAGEAANADAISVWEGVIDPQLFESSSSSECSAGALLIPPASDPPSQVQPQGTEEAPAESAGQPSVMPSDPLDPSTSRVCSIRGCKRLLRSTYAYKMCEPCRGRYKKYGTTKRAKWKQERVAANAQLNAMRAEEDSRRTDAGLKPLTECPDDLHRWEAAIIKIQDARSKVLSASLANEGSSSPTPVLDPSSSTVPDIETLTEQVAAQLVEPARYGPVIPEMQFSHPVDPLHVVLPVRMCTVSHCHKVLPGSYRYRRCEAHRLQNRHHSNLKRARAGRGEASHGGADGPSMSQEADRADEGHDEQAEMPLDHPDQLKPREDSQGVLVSTAANVTMVDNALPNPRTNDGTPKTSSDAPITISNQVSVAVNPPVIRNPSQASASVLTSADDPPLLPAQRGIKRKNHVCSIQSCENMLSPAVHWKMCDGCRCEERRRRKDQRARDAANAQEPAGKSLQCASSPDDVDDFAGSPSRKTSSEPSGSTSPTNAGKFANPVDHDAAQGLNLAIQRGGAAAESVVKPKEKRTDNCKLRAPREGRSKSTKNVKTITPPASSSAAMVPPMPTTVAMSPYAQFWVPGGPYPPSSVPPEMSFAPFYGYPPYLGIPPGYSPVPAPAHVLSGPSQYVIAPPGYWPGPPPGYVPCLASTPPTNVTAPSTETSRKHLAKPAQGPSSRKHHSGSSSSSAPDIHSAASTAPSSASQTPNIGSVTLPGPNSLLRDATLRESITRLTSPSVSTTSVSVSSESRDVASTSDYRAQSDLPESTSISQTGALRDRTGQLMISESHRRLSTHHPDTSIEGPPTKKRHVAPSDQEKSSPANSGLSDYGQHHQLRFKDCTRQYTEPSNRRRSVATPFQTPPPLPWEGPVPNRSAPQSTTARPSNTLPQGQQQMVIRHYVASPQDMTPHGHGAGPSVSDRPVPITYSLVSMPASNHPPYAKTSVYYLPGVSRSTPESAAKSASRPLTFIHSNAQFEPGAPKRIRKTCLPVVRPELPEPQFSVSQPIQSSGDSSGGLRDSSSVMPPPLAEEAHLSSNPAPCIGLLHPPCPDAADAEDFVSTPLALVATNSPVCLTVPQQCL
ncbi:hypothetical protein HGRIS_000527 [Hohenbuehelia grisea]|uniref:Uncharacterized protein n=1 Tax=Hohenbuehelia grisea TaxID=104357 RepID=A0ABR3JRA7_9AGAR